MALPRSLTLRAIWRMQPTFPVATTFGTAWLRYGPSCGGPAAPTSRAGSGCRSRRHRSRSRSLPAGTSSKPGNHGEQRPRLAANLLAVAEVARVVIRHLERNGTARRDRPECHQELGDVLDLGDEPSRFVVQFRGQDVRVVLEHRTAAGGVDDDRVDAGRFERLEVAPGKLEGRPLDPRVVVDRAAARPVRAGSRPRSRSPEAHAPSPRWSPGTWRRPRSPGTRPPAPASARSAAGPRASGH